MLTQPTSNKSQLSNKSNNVNHARVWVNHDTSHLEHAYFGIYREHTQQ